VHRIPSPHAHRVEIENSGESGIGAGFVVENSVAAKQSSKCFKVGYSRL
jgi:hypothetical protein